MDKNPQGETTAGQQRQNEMVACHDPINCNGHSADLKSNINGRFHSSNNDAAGELKRLKDIALAAVDSAADELHRLSREIWLNPELHYKEFKAHHLLTDFLEKKGFVVDRSFKLETAFRATVQSDGLQAPNVAIICEYDALPGIGHGCGHNLIAEVGVGASLAVKAAMLASSHKFGRVHKCISKF